MQINQTLNFMYWPYLSLLNLAELKCQTMKEFFYFELKAELGHHLNHLEVSNLYEFTQLFHGVFGAKALKEMWTLSFLFHFQNSNHFLKVAARIHRFQEFVELHHLCFEINLNLQKYFLSFDRHFNLEVNIHQRSFITVFSEQQLIKYFFCLY